MLSFRISVTPGSFVCLHVQLGENELQENCVKAGKLQPVSMICKCKSSVEWRFKDILDRFKTLERFRSMFVECHDVLGQPDRGSSILNEFL